MTVPLLTAAEAAGAVDLDNIPCTGCRHRSSKGVCKRWPPVFRPAQPARTADGREGILEGGWTFPPAVVRCGEWSSPSQ